MTKLLTKGRYINNDKRFALRIQGNVQITKFTCFEDFNEVWSGGLARSAGNVTVFGY